ncbi:MAG TPA: DinB family protein [Methylomirabilota bacterium]
MAVPAALLARLETQLGALDLVLGLAGTTPGALDARPRPEEWSARENLAHLARHHAVFLERLRRLLTEDRPALGRYRAEEDPEWPAWATLPPNEILDRLRGLRAELVAVVRPLSVADSARTGLHPTFGQMDVAGWLDFFLLHEAHHLYTALVRVGEARRRPGALPR